MINLLKTLSTEDLVVMFQNEVHNSLNQNDILAEIMVRMDKVINLLARQYSNIPNSDNEDRVSLMYATMPKCLKDFDINKGYKFKTLTDKYFKQALATLHRDMTREKRFGEGVYCDSLEEMQETKRDKVDDDSELNFGTTLSDFDRVEVLDLLDRLDLKEKEFKMCVGFIDGKTQTEIAKEMDMSSAGISWLRGTVKKKLISCGAY